MKTPALLFLPFACWLKAFRMQVTFSLAPTHPFLLPRQFDWLPRNGQVSPPVPCSQATHSSVPTLNGTLAVRLSALNMQRGVTYPSIVEMKGNVEIQTPVCLPVGEEGKLICDGQMIVHADEAKLHEDTGEIEANDNVVVTLLRHEPKR